MSSITALNGPVTTALKSSEAIEPTNPPPPPRIDDLPPGNGMPPADGSGPTLDAYGRPIGTTISTTA